ADDLPWRDAAIARRPTSARLLMHELRLRHAAALRFFSRATALTVDVSAAVAKRSSDLDGPNTVDSDFSTRFLSTRVGFRHYGSARRGIAGLFGAGAILSYNWANGTPG